MSSSPRTLCRTAAFAITFTLAATTAQATLPPWLQHVVGASTVEQALYRLMSLPSAQTLYPRPPKEAQIELAKLPDSTPDLYPIRARTDEAALNLDAAESDWKAAVAHAQDPSAARLDLANFYHRQLRIPQEIATLREVAAAPSPASERFTDPGQQRAWQASLRILSLIAEQDLPASEAAATYDAWLARYPAEPAVYARAFSWQLDQKNYTAAEALIPRYHQAFPQDQIFPIRARALLEFRRGDVDAALAVYDKSFQPLWPADLIQSYFALLAQTHRQRAFLAAAHASLAAHPDGPEALNAVARIFYYQQQQGRVDQAQQAIDAFRIARESRNGSWPAEDLATLATLSASIHNYSAAARYSFALASSSGALPSGEPAAQSGLSGLIDLLLTAPDQPIALGAGNLTLYRDIATLDQGPGYWNGILSLWLNGTSPASEYDAETAKAQSYFHRSKAAELLAELDQKFPAAPERPALHASLIRTYASYSESAAVIAAGKAYLAAFPQAAGRVEIAGLVADAYQRQQDTAAEFALYDSMLTELAAKTSGQPLSASRGAGAPSRTVPSIEVGSGSPSALVRVAEDDSEQATPAPALQAFSLDSYTTSAPHNQFAVDYAQVLDRYLNRLVVTGKIPQALAVLRRQIDRSPDDPALYERLAQFLGQNNLAQAQEDTYRQALARFNDRSVYSKLAGLYIREKRREDFAALVRQVTDIFSGTELDRYFSQVEPGGRTLIGPQLNLQLNLYAAKRFPHDLVFVQNLLGIYRTRPTVDNAAYEALLRRHWSDSPDLRDQFFAYLSRTNKLNAEINALGAPSQSASSIEVGAAATEIAAATAIAAAATNPAATRELAEANIWTSQFESATPLLGAVATLYPADEDLGDRAVSLYRSLSYLDPTKSSLQYAVAIETNLLAAAPDSPDRLATLGDLYAEATSTGGEDLASASPYWNRIPALHPGTPAGYLTSATIFWDYFQFDRALTELTTARTRFHQPALYGYEAGAIEENRRDLPAAVADYTASAIQTPELAQQFNAFVAVAQAYFKPPSDAADSNFRSTAQSFFNSDNSRARLLQLANRPATKTLVDQASAAALTHAIKAGAPPQSASSIEVGLQQTPITAALTLRADILTAQHRQPELTPLFTQSLARVQTADEAAAIAGLAQSHTLPAVYEEAVTRQAALTTDPVEKIQLEYTLARSLESRREMPAATRVMDAVYRANPRILGVVRATTDFYARNAQPKTAIATLLEASRAATPQLARSFTVEAAQRANDAGDPAQARTLALTLLPATPYDPTVLAIIAASYAKANDNAGLKTFYLAQLDRARTDPALTLDDRKQDVALLRRGLIPALSNLHDYEGALAQYIALLSAFPEDSATAQEAALYALRNQRQPQLVDSLQTTVRQSPKDSRFAVLLAQVDTTFEDLPGAVRAYDAAIAIRKDRVDLYQARVDLNLRLGQTDPARLELAAADLSHLYLLTYKDPQWMVRLAELRARQQRPADAVKALTVAYIDDRPRKPENFFTVAAQLEKWNLLSDARVFAQQGVTLAGPTLLTDSSGDSSASSGSGAIIYARILTRLGKPDEVLTTLTRIRKLRVVFPAEKEAEFVAQGLSAKDIAGQRAEYIEQREQMAQSQLSQALNTAGAVVADYYSPEQKLAYAQTLDTLHITDPALALTAATSAGLADREALWRRQILLNGPLPDAEATEAAYVQLQQRRLTFTELAQTLETYAPRQVADQRNGIFQQAANAWAEAGDDSNELRILRRITSNGDRLHDLLFRHDRPALDALAASHDDAVADSALNYILSHADLAQSTPALQARGGMLSPLWTDSAYALAALYLAPAAAHDSFARILRANSPIADRIAHPSDSKTNLTGDLYFYYASRFGIALNPGAPSQSASSIEVGGTTLHPEDFLPAELERSPTDPAAYAALARAYDEAANPTAAAVEYRHALELTPRSIPLNDALAQLLYRSGHRDEALAQWRNAFAILHHDVEINSFPNEFYTGFESILHHLGDGKLTAQFHPEIESVVRPYFAKNGNYRSNEFLEVTYTASSTPAEGTAFILSLSTAAPDPAIILVDLDSATWLSDDAREAILLRRIELNRAGASAGAAANSAALNLYAIAQPLLAIYVAAGEYAKAQSLLDSLPPAPSPRSEYAVSYTSSALSLAQYRILLAAHAGRLPALLDTYRADPAKAPTLDTLIAAANTLDARAPFMASLSPAMSGSAVTIKPDPTNARLLREYVFDQKQLTHALIPTDFLSLAQSRIETNDLPGALELLRRLTLQPPTSQTPAPTYDSGTPPDNPYTNTDSAASLLESTHHSVEAIPFLQTLVQTVPWNSTYRLRLAHCERDAAHNDIAIRLLHQVAADPQSPYANRVAAAQDLRTLAPNTPALGSAELTFLASTNPASTNLGVPFMAQLSHAISGSTSTLSPDYFVEARISAATSTNLPTAAREALLREAIAIAPTTPAADHARLTLLLAADDSTNPATILSLLAAARTTAAPANSNPDSADDTTAGESATEATDTPSEGDYKPMSAAAKAIPLGALPPLAAKLDLPTRIRLTLLIARACERNADLPQALSYVQLALVLSESPDAALIRRRDDLKARIRLDQLNATRRPIFTKNLAQPNDVRPRLTIASLAKQEAR